MILQVIILFVSWNYSKKILKVQAVFSVLKTNLLLWAAVWAAALARCAKSNCEAAEGIVCAAAEPGCDIICAWAVCVPNEAFNQGHVTGRR